MNGNELNGFFNQRERPDRLYELNYEKSYLKKAVSRTKHSVDDVVGVVLLKYDSGTRRCDKLYSMSLTEKGRNEAKSPELKQLYNRLKEHVGRERIGSLQDDLSGRGREEFYDAQKKNPTFTNLGGPDRKKRLLVNYCTE